MNPYGYILKWNILAAGKNCLPGHMYQTGAAWYLHMHHANAFRLCLAQNLGQLVLVSLDIIQLGTGHQQGIVFQNILMEPRISKGYAVGGQHYVRPLQERRRRWHQC